MIVVIRITGKINLKTEIKETLIRLRLGKKYTCTIINEKDKIKVGMLKKVKDYVAYGELNKPVLLRLIEKRGKREDKKQIKDIEKIAEALEKGEKFESLGLKGYFRLHPPRGGLKSSRRHFPQGVLGNNKQEINKLIERML